MERILLFHLSQLSEVKPKVYKITYSNPRYVGSNIIKKVIITSLIVFILSFTIIIVFTNFANFKRKYLEYLKEN